MTGPAVNELRESGQERRIVDRSVTQGIIDRIKQNARFEWVAIDQMVIPDYARALSKHKVEILRKNFRLASVGTLYFSERGELWNEGGDDDDAERHYDTGVPLFAVMDGTHRMASAWLEGYTELPGFIYTGLSYEQEAQLYNDYATVNRQTALDRYRAKLAAKDSTALALQRIVFESGGMEIATTQDPAAGKVRAVYQLELIYTRMGADNLSKTCQLLKDAWGAQGRAWIEDVIRGVSMLILRYDARMDRARMIERMQLTTPEAVIGRGDMKRVELTQTQSSSVVGRVLHDLYNEGLRSEKERLAPWEDRKFGTVAREELRAKGWPANFKRAYATELGLKIEER